MSAPALSRRHVLAAGAAVLAGARMAAAQSRTIAVTVKDLAFAPQAVEARVGDVIEWTNADPFDHTATVKGGWDIPIPAGKSASHVVAAGDNVGYFCRFHPNMTGTIKVVA